MICQSYFNLNKERKKEKNKKNHQAESPGDGSSSHLRSPRLGSREESISGHTKDTPGLLGGSSDNLLGLQGWPQRAGGRTCNILLRAHVGRFGRWSVTVANTQRPELGREVQTCTNTKTRSTLVRLSPYLSVIKLVFPAMEEDIPLSNCGGTHFNYSHFHLTNMRPYTCGRLPQDTRM